MSTRGIIYLLVGQKYIVQLAVSLWSMRQRGAWFGPVTILCGDGAALAAAQSLIDALGSAYETQAISIPMEHQRSASYAIKPALWQYSPYDSTLFVDADTLFTGGMLTELWPQTDEEIVLTQFADWTTGGRRIGGRIKPWGKFAPQEVAAALARGDKAVNTGVFGFRKTASIFKDWHALTLKNVCFICDELACQIVYPSHPHRMLDSRYNHSTRVPAFPAQQVVIWHGHGRQFIRHDCGRKVWMPWLDRTLNAIPWLKENLSSIDTGAYQWWTQYRQQQA